jgi:hypothetical protein
MNRGAHFTQEWIWPALKHKIFSFPDEFIYGVSAAAPIVVVVDDHNAAHTHLVGDGFQTEAHRIAPVKEDAHYSSEIASLHGDRANRSCQWTKPVKEPKLKALLFTRSYASQARMAGMPLELLKEQLGHKDLRMTMRYAKIGKPHQQQQVEQFAPAY